MTQEKKSNRRKESNSLETTKRQFMKLLGVGVGAGSASVATDGGVVSAIETADSGHVQNVYTKPARDELPDLTAEETPAVGITDQGIFGYDASAGEWKQFTDEPIQNLREVDSTYGLVDRPLQSTEARTIHVDAASGSDDATGTEDDPLATVQEAFNRTPVFIYHEWTIDVADGEYLQDEDVFATRTGLHLVWAGDNFTLLGNTDNPENVVINALNAKFFGKLEDIHFEGITVKYLAQFAGPAFVRSCRFLGKNYRSGATSGLSGKSGQVFLNKCQIGNTEEPPTYGIQPSLYDMYFVRKSSIYARDYAVDNSYGKQARVQISRNSSWEAKYGLTDTGPGVSAEDGSADIGSGTLFVYDRTMYIGDGVTVCDDFDDNRLRDRITMNGGSHGGYRPEWSLVESTYASDGKLIFPGSSDAQAAVPSSGGVGTWDFDIAIGSEKPGRGPPDHARSNGKKNDHRSPSNGEFSAYFLSTNGGEDAYQLRFATDGRLTLEKHESGAMTTLGTGSWGDPGRHFVRITRDKDGTMIISIDGGEEIATTAEFQPRVSDDHAVRFANSFDTKVRLDNLRIRQNAIDDSSAGVLTPPEDGAEDEDEEEDDEDE